MHWWIFDEHFQSLDYSACWEPVCNEYETDEVQSVLSARVLAAASGV